MGTVRLYGSDSLDGWLNGWSVGLCSVQFQICIIRSLIVNLCKIDAYLHMHTYIAYQREYIQTNLQSE